MKIIKLSDVNISKRFLNSTPRNYKVEKAERYIEKYGRIDKPLVLNNGVLVDGYVRYVAANLKGLKEVPYVELQELSYIIGKFDGNDKEYIWKNDRDVDVDVGDTVLVRNKDRSSQHFLLVVTVTNIFKNDDLQLYKTHKSVIKKVYN